jgi:transcriptional regulator GlxA family with amidase domain
MSAPLHKLGKQSATDRFRTVPRNARESAISVPGDKKVWRTSDRRVQLVLMLVEENSHRPLAIGDIAKVVNLSPGRLAHLFKSELGTSPQRYLNNVRIEKAREVLEVGVLSVKETAASVGITNVSRFCRSFRCRYGVTPNEYRKTHLKIDAGKDRFLHLTRVGAR